MEYRRTEQKEMQRDAAKHPPQYWKQGSKKPGLIKTAHMSVWDQAKTPLADALQEYRHSHIVSFDVPGHKQGKGHKSLVEYFGKDCVSIDVNSMKPLDNLIHPVSVIQEAESLAAQAFGAKHAFFMVNGTSSSVQTMVLSVCQEGDKLILPRNVHRSAINALILSGALPIYVDPGTNTKLGIPLAMRPEDVEKAIQEHPDAKAVLVNNPTYYGICTDLKRIVDMAHKAGMKVLVDEAHGTHFYFGQNLPIPAMVAGADMAAVSIHKTGGSLTQSALLLLGTSMEASYVRGIINLTQTTSASYLLMASLDIARKDLALHGLETFDRVMTLASYAREEINKIGGYYAFSSEICDGKAAFHFDQTKLSVHTRAMGLAGIEVYDLLRDEYDIQIEFGDIGNMLAILSVGDRAMEIERLIAALAEIKRRFQKDSMGLLANEYIQPELCMSPREAFYTKREKVSLPLHEAKNYISAESVMCYPPGIPILAPGERVTEAALEYIHYAKERGCFMTGPEDLAVERLKVIR